MSGWRSEINYQFCINDPWIFFVIFDPIGPTEAKLESRQEISAEALRMI